MDSDDDESIQFHEDQTDVGSVQFVEEDSESIQFYPDSESGTNKSSVRGSFAQQPGQWFNAVRQQPQQQQPPPVAAAPPVQQPPAPQVQQQQPQPQELPPPSAPAADASVSPTPRMEPAASMRSSSGDGKKKSVVQNILRSRGESVQRKLGSSLSSSNLNQQRQPPPQVQQQQQAPQAVVEQPAAPAQSGQSAQSPVTETAKGDAPKMLNASFDFPSAVSQGEESESGTPADHRSPNERNNAIPPALQQQMQDQQKQQQKPAGKSGAGGGVQDIIGTSSTDSDVQIPVPRHGREATRAPTTASGASDGQSAGAPPPRNTGRRGTLPPPIVNHQRTGTATSIRSGGRVRLEEQHLQPRQDAGRAVLDHVEEQVMIQQQAQHEKQQVRPGSAGASRPGTAMSGTMPMLDLSGVTAGTMPQMPPAATYPAETPHDTPRLGAMNAEIVHARGLTDMCRAYNQMQADEVERIDAMLYDAKMDLDVLKHSLSQQEQQEQAKKAVLARGQRHMMEKAGGSPLATIVDANARNGAPLVAAPVRRASGPVKPPVQQQAPKVVKQKPSPAAAPVTTQPQTARVPSAGYAQAVPVTAAPVTTSRLPPQQPPQRQAAPILTHQLTPPRERAHPRSASANRPAAKPRKAVTKAKPKRSTSSQAPRTLLPTSNDPVLLAARSFGVSAASLGTGTLYFTNGVALTPEQIETFSAAIEEQRRMGDGARSDAASATLLQGGGAYGGVGQTLSTAETAMLSPSKYHPPALLTKHSKPKTARKNSDNTMQDNGVHPSKRTKFTRTQVVRHAFNLLDFKQRGVLQGCVLDELEGVLAVDAAQCVDPSTSALLHAADPTIDPMAFAPSTRRKLSGLESIGGGGVKRFRRLCAFCNDVIIPVLRGSGHDEWEFSTVAQLVLREVPEDDAMMAALMAVPGSN